MMQNGLIDWVDAVGKLWGCARRRIDLKLESWPESVGARIQDGVPPENFAEQRFPEVFTGEVLRFNLAVRKLSECHRKRVYIHYVIPVPLRDKIALLQLSKAAYYSSLATAHRRIANTLDYDTPDSVSVDRDIGYALCTR